MKVRKDRLDLALATNCKTASDLRDEFSSSTIARIRGHAECNLNPKTVGRLAKALGVPVEYLVEEVH